MDDRKQKIVKLRKNKWTWSAIGTYFGISRARAHQIGSGYNPNLCLYDDIKSRDNYKCQWQKKCNGDAPFDNLVTHHIDFNDRNNNPKNLITLCRACHRYFHSEFHTDPEKEKILQTGHNYITKLFKVKCKNCGKEYNLTESDSKKFRFCDSKCRKEYSIKKRKTICQYCGKEYIRQCYSRKSKHCSTSCASKSYWNKLHNIKKLDN